MITKGQQNIIFPIPLQPRTAESQWTVKFQFLTETSELFHHIPVSSLAHLAYYLMATRGSWAACAQSWPLTCI